MQSLNCKFARLRIQQFLIVSFVPVVIFSLETLDDWKDKAEEPHRTNEDKSNRPRRSLVPLWNAQKVIQDTESLWRFNIVAKVYG